MQIVLKEGYSVSAPDLSSLVTKLRAARPDVLFHTGYNPDITLFLRQAQGAGPAGQGATSAMAPATASSTSSRRRSATDVEGFHSVDPPPRSCIDPKKLKPGVGEMTQEMVKRYRGVRADPGEPSPRTSRWASTTCGSC